MGRLYRVHQTIGTAREESDITLNVYKNSQLFPPRIYCGCRVINRYLGPPSNAHLLYTFYSKLKSNHNDSICVDGDITLRAHNIPNKVNL